MNGIERLEEIKSRVWKDKGTYEMGDYSQREGYIYTLSDYDYKWLIEQAERVQELEEQNKRYREALEYIGNHVNDSEWMSNVVDTKLIKAIIREALEELK